MTLKHLRSSALNKRPQASGMADGQLAINTASGSPGLFFKDTNGSIVKIGPVHVGSGAPNASPASGGTTGNSLGEQWLDTSGGGYVFKIWDGGAWRSETGEFVNASGDTMTGSLVLGSGASLVFEGSTDDGFETTLTVVDPTADRTIILPNVNGTVITTGDTGTVTSTMLLDGTIVNDDINASAAIVDTKLATIATADKVSLSALNIDGATDIGSALADADLFIVDDGGGGVNRKAAASRITDYTFGKISGDITITSSGVSSISAGTIVNADVNASAAIAGTKISPDFGSQNVTTTGTVTGASLNPTSSTVPTNGVYLPAANSVAISTNGTKRIEIQADGDIDIDNGGVFYDATNNRLAIGTTSPSAILHSVVSSAGVAFRGSNNNTSLDLYANDISGEARITASRLGGSGGKFLSFYTDTGSSEFERARIDSSGRLLVGTSGDFGGGKAQVANGSINIGTFIGAATGTYEIIFEKARSSTIGANTSVASGDNLGQITFKGADGSQKVVGATINAAVDGTPGANDMPGRLVFSTTADGASSPTERFRISNTGVSTFTAGGATVAGNLIATFVGGGIGLGVQFYEGANTGASNAANSTVKIGQTNLTGRSINAAGSLNANGADYAEYMFKAGDFTITKGDVCGIDANGKLTTTFADAISFVVKSTDPSYVGNDSWGIGFEDDEEALEAERQKVDRVAFAGQVPVNVLGATPGQYIVPVEAADAGIEGIAKNETDLTLAEYMRAVGKVIAIEDDGRARIIVKVA